LIGKTEAPVCGFDEHGRSYVDSGTGYGVPRAEIAG
jgi:hypothetical protein